jgi:hypothetical protein
MGLNGVAAGQRVAVVSCEGVQADPDQALVQLVHYATAWWASSPKRASH